MWKEYISAFFTSKATRRISMKLDEGGFMLILDEFNFGPYRSNKPLLCMKLGSSLT